LLLEPLIRFEFLAVHGNGKRTIVRENARP
jgi:hypothetical protein